MKKANFVVRIVMALGLLYGLSRIYGLLSHQLVVAHQADMSPDQITEEVMQAAFYAIGMVVVYFGVVWILDGLIGLFRPAVQGKCPSCDRPYHLEENFCPKCGHHLKEVAAETVESRGEPTSEEIPLSGGDGESISSN